jgi:hypothetical protein
MSKTVMIVALLAAAASLSACQTELLSSDRIASNTASVINVRPDQVTIADRYSDQTNTYYTARTNAGASYACVINGGGLLAAGMVDTPTCKQNISPAAAQTTAP